MLDSGNQFHHQSGGHHVRVRLQYLSNVLAQVRSGGATNLAQFYVRGIHDSAALTLTRNWTPTRELDLLKALALLTTQSSASDSMSASYQESSSASVNKELLK